MSTDLRRINRIVCLLWLTTFPGRVTVSRKKLLAENRKVHATGWKEGRREGIGVDWWVDTATLLSIVVAVGLVRQQASNARSKHCHVTQTWWSEVDRFTSRHVSHARLSSQTVSLTWVFLLSHVTICTADGSTSCCEHDDASQRRSPIFDYSETP